MAESAAQRERMARERAATFVDGPPSPEPAAPVGGTMRERVANAWSALVRRTRGLASGARLGPRALRARLLLIAVLAGMAGAAAMVGVEAATGAGGTPARAYLGVELGAPLVGQGGAVVEAVDPSGPARAAGVAVGDVITAVDGRPVADPAAAVTAIAALPPGSTATLAIDRLGTRMTVAVTLGRRTAASP